jgi:DNA-binding CsgD family transcriptional regulator
MEDRPPLNLFDLSDLTLLVNQIRTGKTPETVFDAFCDSVSVFGFTFLSMGRLLPARRGAQSPQNIPRQFHLSRGADALMEELVSTGDLITKSPLVLHGFRVSEPFRWREAFIGLSEQQKLHIKRSQSHGLHYGICFPILKIRTAPGLMSLGRETDFRLTLQDKVALEVLVRIAFERMYEVTEMQSDPEILTITEREREVLYFVAQGKTNWEIGAILGISEYSVRDHLKSISKRMETSNRTHTITKAIRLGLILPV